MMCQSCYLQTESRRCQFGTSTDIRDARPQDMKSGEVVHWVEWCPQNSCQSVCPLEIGSLQMF